MTRLGRKGRILKWAGLFVSMLIVVAWAISLHGQYECAYIFSDHSIYVASIHDGCLSLWTDYVVSSVGGFLFDYVPSTRMVIRWAPEYESSYLLLPLWIPFLVISVPTAYLWYCDRRRIPPHCCQQCGYDLTGNTSGICPECGYNLDLRATT